MGKFYGESEARLRSVFEDAQAHAPAIIFIDEIDAIAPKREEMGAEKQVERRVVAQLLALMDGLESRGQIIVIGATNIPNTLDPALRRPGRFDREISIPIPDKNGRLEILQIHTRGMPLAEDVNLEKLAEITHGFVGADLEALAREAAMSALRKILPKINFEMQDIPYETLMKLEVTMDNFQEAMKEVEPSAIREVFVEVPDVKWEDVGGLESIKEELKEAIEWPLKYQDVFKKANTNPPKGILLYGAPGTGKTLLAKAVATESGVNFISVKGPSLISKYVGESERAIREVFKIAKQASPTILFFDEIESLVPVRGGGDSSHVTERVISQFLAEMDGIEELKGVVVLAATNRLDLIDPALLRSGRFDLMLELPKPDQRTREEIFKIHTKNKPKALDIDLKELAKESDGKVGSDIEFICRKASMLAIREFIDHRLHRLKETDYTDLKITKRHFEEAVGLMNPVRSKSPEATAAPLVRTSNGVNTQSASQRGSGLATE
jgi:transitional endoplasmic reticulum ATPase